MVEVIEVRHPIEHLHGSSNGCGNIRREGIVCDEKE
jgi:hypothetical protein